MYLPKIYRTFSHFQLIVGTRLYACTKYQIITFVNNAYNDYVQKQYPYDVQNRPPDS